MSVGESKIMRALPAQDIAGPKPDELLAMFARGHVRGFVGGSRYEFFAARRELSGYSYLSATMGSTRVARLDGK